LRAHLVRLTSELAAARAHIERLTFTLQHELRAPLRHVGAFVQVIEEDHGESLNADVKAHLKTIQEVADKAMQLLDGLHAGALKP
jgi:light-regulated signal transduction histidine kinase (bacteriophytochrome)